MQHSRELDAESKLSNAGELHPDQAPSPLLVSDRGLPAWAAVTSWLFTFAEQAFLIALSILGAFFVSVVVHQDEVSMIPVLVAVGIAFACCLGVLKAAHARALLGYRSLRESQQKRAAAALSIVMIAALSVVHPFAGLGIFIGLIIGAGLQYSLYRYAQPEPHWEFLPSEALSVMAGRDSEGLSLAKNPARTHAFANAIHVISIAISLVLAYAAGSFLVAENILNEIAFAPLVLVTIFSVHSGLIYVREWLTARRTALQSDALVTSFGHDTEEEEFGLSVRNLNVLDSSGEQLLSSVSFQVPPGSVTGIIGDSGAGKSLLLRALADPFALSSLEVNGQVKVAGSDIWERSAKRRASSVVYLPDQPILLPASGIENLGCVQDEETVPRAKALLERFVLSHDIVERMCSYPDARHLPRSQAQSLAFTRAFLMSPELYLFDRPEDGISQKQVSVLLERIALETRIGRSFIIVSDNRQILEACDRLVVLQFGRIIDQGPAEIVRDRVTSGWSKIVTARRLDSEENLVKWVHSQFLRGPEDANKRRVSTIISDMLTLSCQKADPENPGLISFHFKHFQGHCVLRMEDTDQPFSSAQFERARQAALKTDVVPNTDPFAAIFQNALEVSRDYKEDVRILEAKIKTFDPRKAALDESGQGNGTS